MAAKKQSKPKSLVALSKLARSYPETEESVACRGTALERSSFKARKKAFLFLGTKDGALNAMVKLDESLPEAKKLATKHPARFKTGAHGWVTLTLADEEPSEFDRLKRWIDESYRLAAPAKKPSKKR